jgi:uncharacterized protein YndB with AHSA1/START domain
MTSTSSATTPSEPTGRTVAPVVREVRVVTDPATAFTLFTDRIGDWWPLATHSVFGEHATVAFEGDRLVERAGNSSAVWGEVLAWEPPQRFAITWHPGTDPAQRTEVTVEFHADAGQTLVRLVHTGWERRADDIRASYAEGWVGVLDRYAAAAGAATA